MFNAEQNGFLPLKCKAQNNCQINWNMVLVIVGHHVYSDDTVLYMIISLGQIREKTAILSSRGFLNWLMADPEV